MKRKFLAILIALIVSIAYIPSVIFAESSSVSESGANNSVEMQERADIQGRDNDAKNNETDIDRTSHATYHSEVIDESNKEAENVKSSEETKKSNQDSSSKKASAQIDLRINIAKYIITFNDNEEVFDGCVHKKTVTVKKYNFSTPLTEGTDYVVTGTTEATDPGTYTFVVTGIGKYKGEVKKTWTISDMSIDDCTIILSDMTYNGKAQTPEVESAFVTKTGKELDKEKFFVNACEKNAGTYTASVTSEGIAKGTKDGVVWKINKENISNCQITTKNVKYDGSTKTPAVSVKIGNQCLSAGDDYKVIYGDEIKDAGKYTISVIGEKNLEGYENVEWTVEPKEITENDVSVVRRTLTYTGEEQHQSVKVIVDGKKLTSADYKLEGDAGTERGVYTLKVTGKNNYTGEVKKYWIITDLDISINRQSFDYDGEIHKPAFAVQVEDQTLNRGTDYEITAGSTLYEKNAGNYTIAVIGKGDYAGSNAIVEWKILPAKLKTADFKLDKDLFIYDGDEKSVSVIKNEAIKNLQEGKDFEVSSDSVLKESLPGDYSVILNGIGNYTGKAVLDWKINGYSLKACVIKINKDNFVYNGQEQGPEITISTAIGNNELQEGKEYTISGTEKAKNAGDYTLQINGMEDAGYYGTKELSWSIAKKEVTVDWKYVEGNTENSFVYDGEKHEVSASLSDIEESDKNSYKLEVEVSGDSVDAGCYEAKVTGFETGGDNYTIANNSVLTYTIEPELVTPVWDNRTSFKYDGFEHAREATLTSKSGVSLKPVYLYSTKSTSGNGYSYSGKKPSEAGDYVVQITGLTDKKGKAADNYEVTIDNAAKTKTFSIIRDSVVDTDDDTRYAKEQTEDPEDDVIFEESINSHKKTGSKKTAMLDSGVSNKRIVVQDAKTSKDEKYAEASNNSEKTDKKVISDTTVAQYNDSGVKSDSGEIIDDTATADNSSIEVFDNSDTPSKKSESENMIYVLIALSVVVLAFLIIVIRSVAAKGRKN